MPDPDPVPDPVLVTFPELELLGAVDALEDEDFPELEAVEEPVFEEVDEFLA